MELIAVLVLLYALQCTAWLPRGGVLFVETALGAWISAGPGFRLLHPLPSSRAWRAARLPLVERGGVLHGRGAVTWLSARSSGDEEPIELGALSGAGAERCVVRVAGRPFAHGADPADAERVARWLRALAQAGVTGAGSLLDEELARAASLSGFRAARARFESATRWLGWSSDAYFISLFALLPVAIWLTASEFALSLLLPVLVALHLATWIALARAHTRLFPERRGDRWMLLIETSLYPPSLLRAHHVLRSGVVASFAPAAVAAGALRPEPARDFLRGEWARAARAARDAARPGVDLALPRRELGALRELLHELGEAPAALLVAPVRSDSLARSYCPACRCEYRIVSGECSDCALTLQPFTARGEAGMPTGRGVS